MLIMSRQLIDVREMLNRHNLTEDIFAKVFENPDFHRQNNVATTIFPAYLSPNNCEFAYAA
jgi:hypothetical protein